MQSFHWDIYNVTGSSVDADGFHSVTVDAEGEQGSVPIPVQHMHGLWSMPLDPVVDPGSGEPIPSKACAVLVAWEGSSGHAWPVNDPRVVANLPTGVPGETILFNDFGAFIREHADGSISLSTTTTGGSPAGQTVASRVMPTGFLEFAPWGRRTFDQNGFRVTHVGGAKLSLGYAGGLVPGLSSTFLAQADIVSISGSAVSIGPSGVAQQPVAQALPLVTILADIAAALQAINAGMALITSLTPGAGPAAAAAPFVQTAAAAIASALATISTRTAIG